MRTTILLATLLLAACGSQQGIPSIPSAKTEISTQANQPSNPSTPGVQAGATPAQPQYTQNICGVDFFIDTVRNTVTDLSLNQYLSDGWHFAGPGVTVQTQYGPTIQHSNDCRILVKGGSICITGQPNCQ